VKKIIVVILFTFIHSAIQAQITIDMNDMPSPGDTIRISNGLITPTIDPVPAGPNHTWDFSSLQWVTQSIDTFLNISQTNPTYQLIFVNLPINPNRANVAAKGNFPVPPFISGYVTDIYNFYYNSSASYKQVGFGAMLAGIATPIPFNNKDVIYNFPLNYNNTDSSDSDLSLSIPGLGYYGFNQHRVNVCEGWGTLITPYGTFNSLKIKSTLNIHDTIFLDTLGQGFGADRPLTREYKWIGKSKSIPLLEIITQVINGQETVTSVRYQDSIRNPVGINEIRPSHEFAIYPNPASRQITISGLLFKDAINSEIKIFDMPGKQVKTISNAAGSFHTISIADLRSGIYFIQIIVNDKLSMHKLLIE